MNFGYFWVYWYTTAPSGRPWFEFVPLELTVEISVTDDPKCQDQISHLLFYGGRLGKSLDMVNLLLSLSGFYSFQECLREGLILLSEDFGISSP